MTPVLSQIHMKNELIVSLAKGETRVRLEETKEGRSWIFESIIDKIV